MELTRSLPRRRLALVSAAVVAALGIGAVALATIPDANGVIHGCYDNNGGKLRVIDSDLGGSCKNGETALNWNQTGPQGPAGSGLTGMHTVQQTFSAEAGQGTEVAPNCPSGEFVISGGYQANPMLQVIGSHPSRSGDSDFDNAWSVAVVNPTASDHSFTVYQVCAVFASP